MKKLKLQRFLFTWTSLNRLDGNQSSKCSFRTLAKLLELCQELSFLFFAQVWENVYTRNEVMCQVLSSDTVLQSFNSIDETLTYLLSAPATCSFKLMKHQSFEMIGSQTTPTFVLTKTLEQAKHIFSAVVLS